MPTKWLTTVPATVDTTSGIARKWNSTTPSALVRPLESSIAVPAFGPVDGSSTTYDFARVQLNYTAPGPFTITNVNEFFRKDQTTGDFNTYVGLAFYAIMCVRYRIGTVAYRYQLWNDSLIFGPNGFFAPVYKGETILPNFCLELITFASPNITPIGLVVPINIKTSLRNVPSGPGAVDPAITGTLYDWSQLGFAIPFNIPSNFPAASYWLDNVAI